MEGGVKMSMEGGVAGRGLMGDGIELRTGGSWRALVASALLALALAGALWQGLAGGRSVGDARALPRLLAPAPGRLPAQEGPRQSAPRGAGADLAGAGRREPGLPGQRLERRACGGEPRAASQAAL